VIVIDRVSATLRPDGKPAGYQHWRDLLFLHWEVPANLLQKIIPKPLIVDAFEGKAFIGLVPFVMKNVRPRWWTLGSGFNFLETNLRTYVVHQGKPGVYFFSLDANSVTAVLAANLGWGLPYYVARQSIHRDQDHIAYSNVRIGSKAAMEVEYSIGEHLGALKLHSIEHFLLERYLLFVKRRGVMHSGQVFHTPYPAQRATVLSLKQTMLESFGLPKSDRPPDYMHYAAGVDVEVFPMIARP